MRFDIVVGNPPYQLADSGHGSSAAPIYHHFFRQAIALRARMTCMIFPSRWFSGGKGLAAFRKEMLSDSNLALVDDFPDASSVFEEVQIKGGVSIVLRADEPTPRLRIISNLDPNNPQTFERKHGENWDVFIRFPRADSILRKVHREILANKTRGETMDSIVSVRRPFSLGPEELGDPRAAEDQSYVLHHRGGISRILTTKVGSGHHLAAAWKIFLPRLASGSDNFPHPVIGKPFIGEPGSVCTETYLAVGPFESRGVAENVLNYMGTRLFRYLCLLRKSSQDTPRAVFKFVPLQDFQHSWDDKQLRGLYRIDDEEWLEIINLVREGNLS